MYDFTAIKIHSFILEMCIEYLHVSGIVGTVLNMKETEDSEPAMSLLSIAGRG